MQTTDDKFIDIRVNWKRQNIINFGIVVMLIVAIIFGVYVLRRVNTAEHAVKVQKVIIDNTQTVNRDSIATLIEQRYQDSLKVVTVRFENQLNQIRHENVVYRKKNKALRDSFDNISIDRPEY